jgi:drug/metabolite transporter (DMT)-like permease
VTRPTTHFGAVEWSLTAFVAVIWGASFLFIRVGVETFGAGLVPALRIGFGLMAIGLVPASRAPIAWRDWPIVAALGLVWMAAPFLLFSLAERTVPTAITGMINGAVPLSSAAVFALWHRQTPSPRRALSLSLGLLGVSTIAFAAAHDVAAPPDGPGVLMLLVAIGLYGVSANITGPLQRRYGSLPVLFRAQLVAFALSVPYGLVTLRTAVFSWTALVAMMLLGSLGTGLAYAILATLVGRTDSTRGTIGVFLTPIVATILGVTVRHEALPVGAFAGAALVLVGAILTSRPEPAPVLPPKV